MKCRSCGEVKHVSNFKRYKKKKDGTLGGYNMTCIECGEYNKWWLSQFGAADMYYARNKEHCDKHIKILLDIVGVHNGEELLGKTQEMTFKHWLTKNFDELQTITKNITNGDDLTDDLFQEVVLTLLNNKKDLDIIPDEEKKYYFISVVRLNFYSKTSRFYYKIRKPTNVWFQFDERDEDLLDEEEYTDKPDIDWVKTQLMDLHWYKRTLFEMWMELGTITKVSQKTTINKNTCGQHIREVKDILQQRWLDNRC